MPNAEHIEDLMERPEEAAAFLDDEQLKAGGLAPVQAWVRTKSGKSAQAARRHRSREKRGTEGVRQISVTAPEEVHDVIKTIAERTRAGEALSEVLTHLAPTHDMTAVEAAIQAAASTEVRAEAAEAALAAAQAETAQLRAKLADVQELADCGEYFTSLTGWRAVLAWLL